MTIPEPIVSFIAALGIPALISSFFLWWIQRRITRRDALRDKEQLQIQQTIAEQAKQAHIRAQVQERYNLLLLESMSSLEILAEATAKAVQRIPDAKCNGDMTAALEQARKIAEEKSDFLHQQAVQNIYD